MYIKPIQMYNLNWIKWFIFINKYRVKCRKYCHLQTGLIDHSRSHWKIQLFKIQGKRKLHIYRLVYFFLLLFLFSFLPIWYKSPVLLYEYEKKWWTYSGNKVNKRSECLYLHYLVNRLVKRWVCSWLRPWHFYAHNIMLFLCNAFIHAFI